MATLESLQARSKSIIDQFQSNKDFVKEVQCQALGELLPELEEELSLGEIDLLRARAFLEDPVTVFRFCRRARFSLPASIALLHATLSFRLVSSLSNPSPSTLPPIYLTQPLFFFHPELLDRFGRPCAVLNLKHVGRTEDGELDGLKEFIRMGWELGRRWMAETSKSNVVVQMVVIVDLEGAGMSNLEVELLPFFMDLLKSHFPGMVGAIFVLNYGWMYAGMWQLAKRILPNTALERILFPTKSELLQFFETDHLLVEHGGTVEYTYTPANPIIERYCRSVPLSIITAYPSPLSSPSLSRNVSNESLDEVFQSAVATPTTQPSTPILGGGSLSRRPSGLSMTALNKPFVMTPKGSTETSNGLWRTASSSSLSNLRRIPSISDFTLHLAETHAAIASDSSGEDENEEEMKEREKLAREYAKSMTESASRQQQSVLRLHAEEEGEEMLSTGNSSRNTSRNTSRAGSRVGSRIHSNAHSRETSPSKRRDGTFASRAVKFSGMDHVSPYNLANPYYGYPAFVPPNSLDPSGIPRPHFSRRRKRDLLRTLTYLAVLRFLALHRNIKYRLSRILQAILTITGLQRIKRFALLKEVPKRKSSIRFEGDGKGKGKEGEIEKFQLDLRLLYGFLIIAIVRSSLLSRVVSLLSLRRSSGKSVQRVVRKRDILKRMINFGEKA